MLYTELLLTIHTELQIRALFEYSDTFTRSGHKRIETKAENKMNSKKQKNGYKSLWIGVANATKSAYYIETHTELFVPEYDTGKGKIKKK